MSVDLIGQVGPRQQLPQGRFERHVVDVQGDLQIPIDVVVAQDDRTPALFADPVEYPNNRLLFGMDRYPDVGPGLSHGRQPPEQQAPDQQQMPEQGVSQVQVEFVHCIKVGF